jgi:hypothetical protein
MKTRFSVLVIATLSLVLGVAESRAQDIDGAYERVSLLNSRTGESPEAANRVGLLILSDGYYSMMTMNPERRVLNAGERLEDLPQDEQVDFLQEWLDINGHTGRYDVDGEELVWYRDLSENPREVGTTTRLEFSLRDDLLVLSFSLRNGDVYEWIWRRLN